LPDPTLALPSFFQPPTILDPAMYLTGRDSSILRCLSSPCHSTLSNCFFCLHELPSSTRSLIFYTYGLKTFDISKVLSAGQTSPPSCNRVFCLLMGPPFASPPYSLRKANPFSLFSTLLRPVPPSSFTRQPVCVMFLTHPPFIIPNSPVRFLSAIFLQSFFSLPFDLRTQLMTQQYRRTLTIPF